MPAERAAGAVRGARRRIERATVPASTTGRRSSRLATTHQPCRAPRQRLRRVGESQRCPGAHRAAVSPPGAGLLAGRRSGGWPGRAAGHRGARPLGFRVSRPSEAGRPLPEPGRSLRPRRPQASPELASEHPMSDRSVLDPARLDNLMRTRPTRPFDQHVLPNLLRNEHRADERAEQLQLADACQADER